MGFLDWLGRGSRDNDERYGNDGVLYLAIDEPFPFRRKSTEDGLFVEVAPLGMFVCMYYSQPTQEEIARIREDDITVYYTYVKPVLECIIQIGDALYGDAPYYAPLYQHGLSERELNPTAIYVCLVDADTNILKSMRIIGLEPAVTQFLSDVQHEQLACGISNEKYHQMVDYLESQFKIEDLAITADCAVVILRNNEVKHILRKELQSDK